MSHHLRHFKTTLRISTHALTLLTVAHGATRLTVSAGYCFPGSGPDEKSSQGVTGRILRYISLNTTYGKHLCLALLSHWYSPCSWWRTFAVHVLVPKRLKIRGHVPSTRLPPCAKTNFIARLAAKRSSCIS